MENLGNIQNEVSTSNQAILCLPVVMSVPPISLVIEVSDTVTAWYALVTNVLAILPLLIKGVELVNAYSIAQINLYSTLSMIGEKHGLFERWDVRCAPDDFKKDLLGRIIILVGAWLMLANMHLEFIFWQRKKHKRKCEIREVVNNMTDGETLEQNLYLISDELVEVEEMETNPKRRCDSSIRYAFSFIFSIGIVMSVSFLSFLDIPSEYDHALHVVLFFRSVIPLVFLRAFAIRQLKRYLRCRCVAGFFRLRHRPTLPNSTCL